VKSRFLSLFAAAAVVVLSWNPVAPAQAANITFTAAGCHAEQVFDFPTYPEPLHWSRGRVANPTNDDRYVVVCDVPRQPLPPGATSGTFYVDGNNLSNLMTTVCVISSYDWNGSFLASASFSAIVTSYDGFLSLPASALGQWAYVSLSCQLPPNAAGSLRGVTSVQ
jgi:hypothetical protein